MLNFAVWILALGHGIAAGTDRDTRWAIAVHLLPSGSVAAACVWRLLRAYRAPAWAVAIWTGTASIVAAELVLAHQHLHQLEPDIRHAVLGNVGTLISFRLGAEDAAMIARELAPTFEPEDLLNLPNYTIYLKLMVNGAPSRPFSAVTLRPEEPLDSR